MASQKKLDLSTVLGITLGIGSVLMAMLLEFGELNPDLGSPFLQTSAILIIFGGSLGCAMLSFPMQEILKIPTLLRIALFSDQHSPSALIQTVVKAAETARREGVLALENRQAELRQTFPFLALGFMHVIDGRPPDAVKAILSDEVFAMEERHKVGAGVMTCLGGYAPTMGIVGTVIGLIGALSKAGEGDSDPNAIVEAIATAFIATFYGIASANLVFLPLASKLQAKSGEETYLKLVQMQAVLAIQNGDNPRSIEQSTSVFFRKEDLHQAK